MEIVRDVLKIDIVFDYPYRHTAPFGESARHRDNNQALCAVTKGTINRRQIQEWRPTTLTGGFFDEVIVYLSTDL
jgi:hypothetical protein